jgi:ketosteroid isomerase-like protein
MSRDTARVMSEENVEIVRRAYDLFNGAAARQDATELDMRWFADLAAPQFEYIAGAGIPGLGGDYRGVDDFGRFLDGFWGTFEEAQARPVELIDAGDAVLAVVNFHGKGAQSGATVEMTVHQLWTFQGDRVVRGQGFLSRAEALEAAGLRE